MTPHHDESDDGNEHVDHVGRAGQLQERALRTRGSLENYFIEFLPSSA
ncbi:hypothetical protein ACLRGI_05425 [Paenarthrobacter nitroguajacolicus]